MTNPAVVMTGPVAVTAADAAKADNRLLQALAAARVFSFCLENHML